MKKTIMQTLARLEKIFGSSIFCDPAKVKAALADILSDTNSKETRQVRSLLSAALADMDAHTRLKQELGNNETLAVQRLLADMKCTALDAKKSKTVIYCIAEFLGYEAPAPPPVEKTETESARPPAKREEKAPAPPPEYKKQPVTPKREEKPRQPAVPKRERKSKPPEPKPAPPPNPIMQTPKPKPVVVTKEEDITAVDLALVLILFNGIVLVGGFLIGLLLPRVSHYLMWFSILLVCGIVLIFAVYTACKECGILKSIPVIAVILALLVYNYAATPMYRLFYYYSGAITQNNNSAYLYAALWAGGILTVLTLVMFLAQNLISKNYVLHLCLLALICTALFYSVEIPLSRTLEARSPVLYEQVVNHENAVRHTLTEDSNLYMMTSFTRRGIFRSSTERMHFPGAAFVPKIPIRTLPAGTEFATTGITGSGLLRIAAVGEDGEKIAGHVPPENTNWSRQ